MMRIMMRILKKARFVILLAIISAIAYADDAVNTNLTQMLKNMHSMQADFAQTIVDKKGRVLQKSYGHMDLQRPSQFRWDTQQPTKQLIVTDGKRLWIYDPDLEQVIIRKLVKAAGETPAMLLSDQDLALGNEFSIRQINNPSSALQWYLLTPKDKSSIISMLKLGFQNQQIQQMQLQDNLGHSTNIVFSHIKINSPISASLFSFKPPAHIDVIDETKR